MKGVIYMNYVYLIHIYDNYDTWLRDKFSYQKNLYLFGYFARELGSPGGGGSYHPIQRDFIIKTFSLLNFLLIFCCQKGGRGLAQSDISLSEKLSYLIGAFKIGEGSFRILNEMLPKVMDLWCKGWVHKNLTKFLISTLYLKSVLSFCSISVTFFVHFFIGRRPNRKNLRHKTLNSINWSAEEISNTFLKKI